MALSVQKGVFSTPTSNGATVTVDLPAGFDLKALMFWGTLALTDGVLDQDTYLSVGFATNDGGSIQQGYITHYDNDAQGTSDIARGINTTACFKVLSASTPTTFVELDVTTFSAEQFIVTATTAPVVNYRIHYMALGGSDITAARVGAFAQSTAAATQNVTVNTGFGQPDLLLFLTNVQTSLTDAGGTAAFGLGAAKSATERRHSSYYALDNNATMDIRSWQGNRAIMTYTPTGTVDSEADLSAKASWPTDGFQLSYTDQAAAAYQVVYLALKGTFTATIGSNTAPTAAAPQTQNLALASGTPKGALLWGQPLPTTAGVDSSHADQGGFFIGGTDGTNEGGAGMTQDDANTTSIASSSHTETKAMQERTPGATGVLTSEADSSISGSDVVLTWNDTDSVAREYQYLLLGQTAAAASLPSAPSLRRRRHLINR